MTARRLIVSADDFGLTAGVDRGIRAAVAAGSVTSVGVLANLAAPGEVLELTALHPGTSLGVHLNLTTGRPVRPASEVPSLVDETGSFLPLAALTRRAFRGRLRRAELAAELAAQLECVRAAGATVDHLDSHEHVHLLPGVMGVAIAVARGMGVPRMRSHRPPLLGGGWRDVAAYYGRHPRRLATHAAKRLLARRLHLAGLATPDGMVTPSLLARSVAGGPLAEWEAVAAALPPGIWELVVHPGDPAGARTPEERTRLGDLVERRGAELAALLDPRLPEMLRAHGVTLVPFAAVATRGADAGLARPRYA